MTNIYNSTKNPYSSSNRNLFAGSSNSTKENNKQLFTTKDDEKVFEDNKQKKYFKK